ncbi:MFS transporter [Streptomyces sp. ST2-7A]|uniref:MFS transporter n=1 Tax=Streptomyces sp. ST2-7A TaxID=2907214 RepID=UPI001F471CCC|nr:MFS transporter [Streptomyces sp. ST2-7A]MCE7083348.1 MFS transporter [Streptomyces sp. ST2-7A]
MTTLPAPHARTTPVHRGPRMWALLLVLAGNMLIDALEVSIVLVALPTIAADLELTPWGVQWIMSGFALGFAAVLLLGPRVTARWGRRRVFLIALLVFTVASVVGGLTDSAVLLVVTRVIKGMCAALTAPTGLAIITTTLPDGPRQRRAVAVYSLFGAAGFTIGVLLSGGLTGVDWMWTFLAPAPVAFLLLVLGLRFIPRDPAHRSAPPVFARRLLRNGPLVRAAVCAAGLNGAYLGLLVLVGFQGHHVMGWSSWQTAVALLPACLPLAVSVPFSARMVERFGTPRLIALGALTPVVGQLFYLADPAPGRYVTTLLPALLLVGLGFVFAFAALNMQAASAVEPGERGMAIPLYQTAVQSGAVVMLPTVAVLLTAYDEYRVALAAIAVAGTAGLSAALPGLRKAKTGVPG